MDGGRKEDDNFRKRYVGQVFDKAHFVQASVSQTPHARRLLTLQEVNNLPTYQNILDAAVKRCMNRDPRGAQSLYGTWSEHNSTKGHVFDEFRKIYKELMLSTEEKNNLEKKLDAEWGTGAFLYHD